MRWGMPTRDEGIIILMYGQSLRKLPEKMDACGACTPHASIFSVSSVPGWKRGTKV